jgi:hypothetical protein
MFHDTSRRLEPIATGTLNGEHAEALELHRAVERRSRLLPESEQEYFLNLVASLTQQVDCLLALNQSPDAKRKWDEANELLCTPKILAHDHLYEDATLKIDEASQP